MEKDKIYNKEYLISYGFKQDEEEEYIFYYYDDEEKGFIPYNITNDMDRHFISNIIQELQMKEDNKKKLEYEQQISNNKVIKIKKEKTNEYLPTHEDVRVNTTSKEFKTLGMLISKSNFNKKGDIMEAYIYEKDVENKLNEWKKEGMRKVPCLKTVKRHIKTLSKITVGENNINLITIENTPNGIVYKIAQNYEGKYFVIIPIEQMKELIICTNNEMLKLYCIFNYTLKNEKDWKPITRSYLVKHMGLTEGIASENYISIAINALRKLGYIKVKTEHIKEMNEQGNIISKDRNFYKLTTYEEWKNKK